MKLIQYAQTVVFLWATHFTVGEKKKKTIGGQAVIEGVMMRGQKYVAWAVRKPNKEIAIEQIPYISLTKKIKYFSWPLIRGFVTLLESLWLGLKAINRSAELAFEQQNQQNTNSTLESFYSFLSITAAIAISIFLFMYLPIWIFSHGWLQKTSFTFNILAGLTRIVLFLIYLFAISMWKDMRRIFEYHGAEHKTVYAYENELPLTIDNVKRFPTYHPRCGTSFLIFVGLVCIMLFAIIDTLVITFLAPYPNAIWRLAVHIALVPLISGISFEILKLSDKFKSVSAVAFFIKPGLWLQKITTKEPDDSQLEVAIAALRAVL